MIDENSSKYFLVPFLDGLGAIVSLRDRELESDKLFINNGPDALYKINYNLVYKVTNPEGFYLNSNNVQERIVNMINDSLREYADNGNVFVVIKEYREKEQDLLNTINKAIGEYYVEATSFKVNFIEPVGGNSR